MRCLKMKPTINPGITQTSFIKSEISFCAWVARVGLLWKIPLDMVWWQSYKKLVGTCIIIVLMRFQQHMWCGDKVLKSIQGICRLSLKMGRGVEQNTVMYSVSDGYQYWFRIFRNTTSPNISNRCVGCLHVHDVG